MASIDDFKNFVKKNPSLIKHVKNDDMSWQKFYEMFDLYGEDNDIWTPYMKRETVKNEVQQTASAVGAFDLLAWLKNIDLDSIQNSVNNLQRVLGVVQDFSANKKTDTKTDYKPRPLYKHFED